MRTFWKPNDDMLLRQALISYLAKLSIPDASTSADDQLTYSGVKPAAVLIPILNISGREDSPEWHLLFTKRTDRVADHKGQVSFPGGRADQLDLNSETTALRESYEEIGLKPQDVQIIGKLENIITITNYLVTPVMGLIPWPYSFILEPEEVSRVFTIPMAWLADPSNHEIHRRVSVRRSDFPHLRDVIYFKAYDGEILWGVSAEITVRFLTKLNAQIHT
jgi:8-oxo-dGTP pyrophosphatase MutT (NUDIX family)